MTAYKPYWCNAPDWAQYMAMDGSGSWFWHENKPEPFITVELNEEIWKSSGRQEYAGDSCHDFPIYWAKTLEKSPMEPKKKVEDNVDIVKVAQHTLDIFEKSERKNFTVGTDPYLNTDHIRFMLQSIILKEVVGDKAHRWLGWVQGVLSYMAGIEGSEEFSVTTFREINVKE